MGYKYITEDNLINKQTYMYSEFEGAGFIADYIAVRVAFIERFESKTTKEYEYAESSVTKMLMKAADDRKLMDKFVKSFEVRKRIYDQYDLEMWRPVPDSGYRCVDAYLLFAEGLLKIYNETKCLKYLSCLLKLDDTLLSVESSLNKEQKHKFAEILLKEIEFVKQVEEKTAYNQSVRWEKGYFDKRDVIKLDEFTFVAALTERSRKYMQMMEATGVLPARCILFGDAAGNEDIKDTLALMLKNNRISFEMIANDINSSEMVDVLRRLPGKYILYSGYGGVILQKDLFELGKEFIHIHAGILPKYRGSTTAYYSMIDEGVIGATAIFMSCRIDEGDIIEEMTYRMPEKGVNIDYDFEPWVRAQVLVKFMNNFALKGELPRRKQLSDEAVIYYIIHPVLKHIALLSMK